MKNFNKIFSNILPGVMIMLLMIFPLFNFAFSQKMKSIEENTIIKLNGLSVKSPSGEDWKYFITPDRNHVQLSHQSSSFITGKENIENIMAYNDSLFGDIEKSESEYAEKFLLEIQSNIESNFSMGMKLIYRRKFDTTIAVRKFYALEFSASDKGTAIPFTIGDYMMFIHFPESFKTKRTFCTFIMLCSYNLPTGREDSNSSDFKPLFDMMKSMKVE